MSPDRFDHLLGLVTPLIAKKDSRFRKAIPECERLALTLRFLATGESQISLSFQFKIGRATVSKFLAETSVAISKVLFEKYMHAPSTLEECKHIADRYRRYLEYATCHWCDRWKAYQTEVPKKHWQSLS